MNILNAIRLVYLISDFIILVLAIKALKKKTKMGNVVAAVMAAGFAVVSFYIASLFAETYFYVSLFNSCVFFSIDIMLLLLVRYIIHFTKLEMKGNSKTVKIIFSGIFLMEAIVLMLNPFHEIAVTFNGYQLDGFTLYTYSAKPYFLFHLGLCYFMVLIGVTFLVYKIRVTPKMYRGRYLNTLLSFIGVVLMNFLFLAGMKLFSIDFSYIFYVLIAVFIYHPTFRYKDRFLMAYRDTVFKNIGLPILLFDYEQHLGDYNEHAMDIFPFLEEYADELMQELNLAQFLEYSGIQLSSFYENETFSLKVQKNDVERIYHGDYVCYKENDGKFSAGMFVLHDVTTEQRLLEQEQTLSRSKTNFLMNISTGIKKPLSVILESITQLQNKQLDADALATMYYVNEAAKMTLKLVDDLMEYSMLETGHYQAKKEKVVMSEYVEFLQKLLYIAGEETKVSMEVDDYLPKVIISDTDKLKRLGGTLIRNSIQQSRGTELRVMIYYSEAGKNKGMLELEVTDWGQDVMRQAMKQIEELLELPEELVDCTTISEGLELYMICRLAKKMGGNIEMRTDEDGNNLVHAYVAVELAEEV